MKEVKRKYSLATFMVIVALVLTMAVMAVRVEKASASIPITAYKTDVAFYTNWGLNPHYGAFWGLIDCNSQWYTGADPHPDYGSFNWWGDHHNVLLLDKTWYLWYSAPKVASNHHAQCNS